MHEKPETSISLDNLFLHLPSLRVTLSHSLSRLVSRLFSSVLIRSRFAIYHRSINLCRDSIFTPAHPSHASTTVLSVLRLPPGWILSQTQSGAPLRAKSEDMIARECLVFYKIGYPSWEILRERERPNFCSKLNSTPAATPIWFNCRISELFRNFSKNTAQFIENFMFIQTTTRRKHWRCWSCFYKRNPHKR